MLASILEFFFSVGGEFMNMQKRRNHLWQKRKSPTYIYIYIYILKGGVSLFLSG